MLTETGRLVANGQEDKRHRLWIFDGIEWWLATNENVDTLVRVRVARLKANAELPDIVGGPTDLWSRKHAEES